MVVHNFNKYILNNSPSGNLFVARFTDANFSFCQQQGGPRGRTKEKKNNR